jgi:hypothetical protein
VKQFNKILSGLLLLGSIFCCRVEAAGAAKIITFAVALSGSILPQPRALPLPVFFAAVGRKPLMTEA